MRVGASIDQWFDRGPSLDLELGVLRPSEYHRPRPLDHRCGYEPPPPVADQNEEMVDRCGIKSLRESTPAPIPAAGRDAHLPPAIAARSARLVGGGLHLHPEQAMVQLCHQIHVGAVTGRQPDQCALAGQPLDSRCLADVPLHPPVDRSLPPVGAADLLGRSHKTMLANASDRKFHVSRGTRSDARMGA